MSPSSLMTLVLALAAAAPASAQTRMFRLSEAADGSQADGSSSRPCPSRNGRFVAFESWATNLDPADTNNTRDIFVKDRVDGGIVRASVASDGSEADGFSGAPFLSETGGFVVFESTATNLVPGDTNGQQDIFWRDLANGVTLRVSEAADGTQADWFSTHPSVSSDGRYVAFDSFATNLVAGDTNFMTDVFVKDMQTGAIQRCSVDVNGNEANGFSYLAQITDDGSCVFYTTTASNLVPGDTNGQEDVIRIQLRTWSVDRVSVTTTGGESAEGCRTDGIRCASRDGSRCVFTADGDDMDILDSNLMLDTYEWDPNSPGTLRVTDPCGGGQGDGDCSAPTVDRTGDLVSVFAAATNLDPDDPGLGWFQAILCERANQCFVCDAQNVSDGGLWGNDDSWNPCVSADGVSVAFSSYATNLIAGDTNGEQDIYLRGTVAGFASTPAQVAPGGNLDLTLWGGMPFSPAFLYVTAVNGTPYVSKLMAMVLDSRGQREISATVPNNPGLSGTNVELRTICVDKDGLAYISGPVDAFFD